MNGSLNVVIMQTTLPNQTNDDLEGSNDLYIGVCETVGSQVPRENIKYINGTKDIDSLIKFEALAANDNETVESLLPTSVTEFFKSFEERTREVFSSANMDTVVVFVIYDTALLHSTNEMLNMAIKE